MWILARDEPNRGAHGVGRLCYILGVEFGFVGGGGGGGGSGGGNICCVGGGVRYVFGGRMVMACKSVSKFLVSRIEKGAE